MTGAPSRSQRQTRYPPPISARPAAMNNPTDRAMPMRRFWPAPAARAREAPPGGTKFNHKVDHQAAGRLKLNHVVEDLVSAGCWMDAVFHALAHDARRSLLRRWLAVN